MKNFFWNLFGKYLEGNQWVINVVRENVDKELEITEIGGKPEVENVHKPINDQWIMISTGSEDPIRYLWKDFRVEGKKGLDVKGYQ